MCYSCAIKAREIERLHKISRAYQEQIDKAEKEKPLNMLVGMEYGYVECEKGNSLDKARINFYNDYHGRREEQE